MKKTLVLTIAVAILVLPGQAFSVWTIGEPIVTYHSGPGLDPHSAQQYVDGGFNLVWAQTHKQLDYAQQFGLRAMWTGALDDTTIAEVRDHPALYSYHVADEPLPGDFAALGATVAHLRTLDPDHLAYINLAPSTVGNSALLDTYMTTVQPDLLSYDLYQFHVSGDRHHYFAGLANASNASRQYNVPFLNMVQSSSWDLASWQIPTGDQLRFLNYTSLAYGAQGISYYVYMWYSHYGGFCDSAGTPTALYDDVKFINPEFVEIAEELQALESVGGYHLGDLPPPYDATDDDPPDPVRLPLATSPFTLSPAVPDTVYVDLDPVEGMVMGLFGPTDQLADATAVLVVNLDYVNGTTTTVLGPGNLEVFDATTSTWTPTGSNQAALSLVAGGGKLVRVAPPPEVIPEPATMVLLACGLGLLASRPLRQRQANISALKKEKVPA